jgi:carbamoyltransferase
MYILGLSTLVESAAVLMRNGEVIAAMEEERFTRVKHEGGFPYGAIQYILQSQNLTLADIDHVAVYWDPYKLGHRAAYMLQTLLMSPSFFLERAKVAVNLLRGQSGQDSGWTSLFRTQRNLESRFGGKPGKIHFLDHHDCHMASCFYPSDFDESAILIMDASGEAACTTWGIGRGTDFKKIDEHRIPHSLGYFYSSVTGYLGFKMFDGEYKVMGLSPYGDPSGAAWIRKNYLRTTGPGRYALDGSALDFVRASIGQFSGTFVDHFGPPRAAGDEGEVTDRHRDIAASAQRAFEEVVLDMCAELRRRTGSANLTIAGGCGLNCTANGKILAAGHFDRIYVPPVPNDSGGALGAAMLLHRRLTGKRAAPIRHAQFGPAFGNDDIEKALAQRGDVQAVKLAPGELVQRAAQALAQGRILAWMQGPMEYGARALGNRSFLADPRHESVRDDLNAKIKKREHFRPFAPSVKAEKASEFFEIDQPSPFMTIVVPVRPEKRGIIPAVTHVDGTARPQTVDAAVNPKYWKLLDAFERLTGVPVLLNTSFNIQEPIVCTPAEALATFARSGVDALAMGDYWVTHAVANAPVAAAREAAAQ